MKGTQHWNTVSLMVVTLQQQGPVNSEHIEVW